MPLGKLFEAFSLDSPDDYRSMAQFQNNMAQMGGGGRFSGGNMILGHLYNLKANKAAAAEEEQQLAALNELAMPTSWQGGGGWGQYYSDLAGLGGNTELSTNARALMQRQQAEAAAWDKSIMGGTGSKSGSGSGSTDQLTKKMQELVDAEGAMRWTIDGKQYAAPPGVSPKDIADWTRQRMAQNDPMFYYLDPNYQHVTPESALREAAVLFNLREIQEKPPDQPGEQPEQQYGITAPDTNRQVTAEGDIITPQGTVIPRTLYDRLAQGFNRALDLERQRVQEAVASGLPREQAVAESTQRLNMFLARLQPHLARHNMLPTFMTDMQRTLANPDLFDPAKQENFRTDATQQSIQSNDKVAFEGPSGSPLAGQLVHGTVVGFEGSNVVVQVDWESLPDRGQSLAAAGLDPTQPITVPAGMTTKITE